MLPWHSVACHPAEVTFPPDDHEVTVDTYYYGRQSIVRTPQKILMYHAHFNIEF